MVRITATQNTIANHILKVSAIADNTPTTLVSAIGSATAAAR